MDRTLILMRHGEADHPAGRRGQKELTPTGALQVADVAQQLVYSGLMPDLVVTSRLKRAIQAGEQASAVFSAAGKKPESSRAYWLDDDVTTEPFYLLDIPNEHRVALLVTHHPNIEDLTSAFQAAQLPGYASAYAFCQKAATWEEFTRPAFFRQWQPAGSKSRNLMP